MTAWDLLLCGSLIRGGALSAIRSLHDELEL